MNSVYKKSVPEGVLDAPTSSPYLKTTPKGELKSLRNIVAQGNFSNSDHSVFTWALDDTGLLTIDGDHDYMTDWFYRPHMRPWDSEKDKIRSVQISDGIKSIGESAFENCTNLQEVHTPDSVTSIGDCAFYGCTSLREIYIPSSVAELGEDVFRGCTGLTHVTMPARFNRLLFKFYYGIPKNIVTFY